MMMKQKGRICVQLWKRKSKAQVYKSRVNHKCTQQVIIEPANKPTNGKLTDYELTLKVL
jgi:hypothetical protein